MIPPRPPNRWVPVTLSILALIAAVAPAEGQSRSRNCDLARSEVMKPFAASDGTRIVYVNQPIFRCQDGSEIRADSAVLFEASGYSEFFRNVVMRDGARILRADTANYQDRIGLLNARGRVRVTDNDDGAEFTGQSLRYHQANSRRPTDELTLEGGFPEALFTPAPAVDSTGAEIPGQDPKPVRLRARWLRFIGEDQVLARGNVELEQDSIDAYGDSLAYDQAAGLLSLYSFSGQIRKSRMLAPGDGDEPLDLRGDTLIARMPGGGIEQVDAFQHAIVTGTAVGLEGPIIRLFFTDEEISRVVATVVPSVVSDTTAGADEGEGAGALPTVRAALPDPAVDPGAAPQPGQAAAIGPVFAERPVAETEEYTIWGDSLEILTPGGRVESLFSSGRARAESYANDSLNTADTPEIVRRDWIEGDSVRAFWERPPGAAEDTEPELRRLVAIGNARSLARFRPDSTRATADSTALNVSYVLGSEIRMLLAGGDVDDIEVFGADGLFLQPAGAARVMGDSTVIRPDSLINPPDTGIVRRRRPLLVPFEQRP